MNESRHDAAAIAESSSLPFAGVDLELALFAQSMDTVDFEEALTKAVATVGGTVLFVLPAIAIDDCQRVAAISIGSSRKREILLVMLGEDGETTRVEDAATSSLVIADLAASYAGLMDRMPSSLAS